MTGKPIVDIPIVVTDNAGNTQTIGRTDVRGKLFVEDVTDQLLETATIRSKLYKETDDPGKAPVINSIDIVIYATFAKPIRVVDKE